MSLGDGVPVTYVRDPDVDYGTTAVVAQMAIASGTNVLDLFTADAAKNGNTLILPVQHIDDQGHVLRQSTLESIYSSVTSGSLYETTLFNAITGTGVSAAAFVGGRRHHTVQHIISGTVTVQTRSSLDGVHWYVEAVNTQSTVLTFQGATKYISAEYTNGSGVLTTLLASAL